MRCSAPCSPRWTGLLINTSSTLTGLVRFWLPSVAPRINPNHAIEIAAQHTFDLARAIPFPATLITTGQDPVVGEVSGECVLVVVVHHIAADGWSMGPMAADLSRAYAARVTGPGPGFRRVTGPVRGLHTVASRPAR